MTALLGLIGQFWPYILSGLSIIAAALYGWAKGKSADTKEAQADKKVSDAKVEVAKVKEAQATANAQASQASADSVTERANVESDVAALPAGAAADQLRNDWTR